MSLSSLFSAITGHRFNSKLPNWIAWGFLCLFQACITFGIEAMIRAGFQPLENISGIANCTWLKRILLFIGIYDQMILWKTMLVKPVVDDTIFDGETKEGGMEMFVMGLSFSGLWQLLLQREVEPLFWVLGRGGLRNGLDWCDFIPWLVTFATLLTGFVRAVKVIVWQLSVLLQFIYCRVEQEAGRLNSEDNEV
ncbi:uncharacterized protein LOC110028857 [Phalaenopsis equestris]|uniref:uncharacterized protein LOC110028857 n=1 Tax=Phalaenopsis equestris TaxID=78828 RepID=UPI0009E25A1C|nr:uncharacterized protein LOC110028857 [Phalaenopsis equestris]